MTPCSFLSYTAFHNDVPKYGIAVRCDLLLCQCYTKPAPALCPGPGANRSVRQHFKAYPLFTEVRRLHPYIKGIKAAEAGPGCLDRRFLCGPYQGGSSSGIVVAKRPGAIQFFRSERSVKRITSGKLLGIGHVDTHTPLAGHGRPELSLAMTEGQ